MTVDHKYLLVSNFWFILLHTAGIFSLFFPLSCNPFHIACEKDFSKMKQINSEVCLEKILHSVSWRKKLTYLPSLHFLFFCPEQNRSVFQNLSDKCDLINLAPSFGKCLCEYLLMSLRIFFKRYLYWV